MLPIVAPAMIFIIWEAVTEEGKTLYTHYGTWLLLSIPVVMFVGYMATARPLFHVDSAPISSGKRLLLCTALGFSVALIPLQYFLLFLAALTITPL